MSGQFKDATHNNAGQRPPGGDELLKVTLDLRRFVDFRDPSLYLGDGAWSDEIRPASAR
jgi:hypothetical protein